MKETEGLNNYPFLPGGGEMGEIIRKYDWTKTSLGDPNDWPQSLRTTVSLILNSAFPMFLFWGEEKICFYNDSFKPSLGIEGKHPAIGKKGKEVWSEIWDYIGPLIDQVTNTQKPVRFEDQLVPFYRNGKTEDIYWTFSYSPAYGDDGKINGTFMVCSETTSKVKNQVRLDKNQEQLLNYFEQSSIAIAIISKENLTFRMVNSFYGELVGRKPHEIENKPLLEALPELKGQGFEKLLEDVIETGIPFIASEVPVKLLRKNISETIYVDLTYQPQVNDEGIINGILVVATDVTTQVNSRKEIKEAEAFLREAIELADLGTWTIDLNTRILNYDQRLRNWFGFTADEVITVEKAYAPITETYRPLVKAAIEHAITPGTNNIYDVEYEITHLKEGLERIIHARGNAYFDDRGIPFKISGTAQDVTRERQIELELMKLVQHRTEELAASNEELQSTNEELAIINEELEESNQNLYRSNEELSQYAYVASHDLQEPLRKIRVFSNMLTKNELSEESNRLLAKIEQSSERMSLLINDLLEFSRLTKFEKNYKPVDLNDIVNNVINDFELIISEKNATITVRHLPVIEVVALQMNQLFYNIISNALKFVDPDKFPAILIDSRKLSSEEIHKMISKPKTNAIYHDIFISDNGIGFDTQYSDQIFEVFKRLHAKDKYPGSGIGLALSRRIVTNHNGILFAESEVGKGTTFHIILPE